MSTTVKINMDAPAEKCLCRKLNSIPMTLELLMSEEVIVRESAILIRSLKRNWHLH